MRGTYLAVFAAALLVPFCVSGAEPPENLGLGLRQLTKAHEQNVASFRAKAANWRHVQADVEDRLVVNVHLDGSKPAEAVRAGLQALGAEVLHVDTTWRDGVISARLPIAQARAAAAIRGIKSVILAPKPIHHAGRVTAESSVVERAELANAVGTLTSRGLLGRGISVGVVSDSYDAAQSVPRASAGVAAGDLPGTGNPDGYTQPVVVIDDNFRPNGGQTDEGRAMAEIVHDIAPAAKLAFSTVQETQSIMAYSIRNLRPIPPLPATLLPTTFSSSTSHFSPTGRLRRRWRTS